VKRSDHLASFASNLSVPGEATYLLAALCVLVGFGVAGDHGALVGGIVGFSGAKSVGSLARSFQ